MRALLVMIKLLLLLFETVELLTVPSTLRGLLLTVIYVAAVGNQIQIQLPEGILIVVVKLIVVLVIVQTVIVFGRKLAGKLVIPVYVIVKAEVPYSTLLVETLESQDVSIPREVVVGAEGLVIPETVIWIIVVADTAADDVKFKVRILVTLSKIHDWERTVPDTKVIEQVGEEGTVTVDGKVLIFTAGEVPRP